MPNVMVALPNTGGPSVQRRMYSKFALRPHHVWSALLHRATIIKVKHPQQCNY